jgi:hypothetical protein
MFEILIANGSNSLSAGSAAAKPSRPATERREGDFAAETPYV